MYVGGRYSSINDANSIQFTKSLKIPNLVDQNSQPFEKSFSLLGKKTYSGSTMKYLHAFTNFSLI